METDEQIRMLDWLKRRKIATHPSAKVDARLALLRCLEKAEAGEIENVYISIEWTRGRGFGSDWSSMPIGTLALHALQADVDAKEAAHFVPKG